MKRATSILFSILILMFFVNCQKKTYQKGSSFTLKIKHSAYVQLGKEKLEIKFTKLVNESRCPPGAQCFWVGNVTVEIAVDKKNDFELGILTSNKPHFIEYKGYKISLQEVKYDTDKHFGKEMYCSIVLSVD